MKGFFEDEEKEPTGELVEFLNCKQCKLDKTCKSPRMEMSGKGKKGILFIAEAPGETEDRLGTQLVGDAGNTFRKYLSALNIDLDEDCWKTNALSCRPPKNKTPSDPQIKYCRPRVMKVIEETKPTVIGLLGMAAVKSVIGSQWKKDIRTMARWRGWAIPDRHFKTWIIPTYHPSYIMRRENESKNGEGDPGIKLFEQDLKKIVNYLDMDPSEYWSDEEDKIIIMTDEQEIINYLTLLTSNDWPEWVSFDYETTGLKPYKKGHDIICVSICDGFYSRSFRMYPSIRELFCKFLKNKSKKIASNLKFEEVWSRAILNTSVNNWGWDTMQVAHILDNREDITSLKFQTYIRYGLADYSSDIEKYIISDDEEKEGANTFNDIRKAPLKSLLKYNALDSLLEYRLAFDQMKELFG
jgi:DNA polymerase